MISKLLKLTGRIIFVVFIVRSRGSSYIGNLMKACQSDRFDQTPNIVINKQTDDNPRPSLHCSFLT